METPNADALIEVMSACNITAEVLALYITAEHPEMDVDEIVELASAEFFALAQNLKQEIAYGVKVERDGGWFGIGAEPDFTHADDER